MENLWKKENSIKYVDMFDCWEGNGERNDLTEINETSNKLETIKFLKNNTKSTESRLLGNNYFAKNDWHMAMDLYNKSLRSAEVDSENVALVYSNRSACFFHLNMFAEALVDIELAKKGNLPDRLLPKLEQRRKQCLKELANPMIRRMEESQPKLDFEANKKFPCLANLVEMKYNQEFGRHLVASRDIPDGKIILLEKYFAVSRTDDFSVCYTCFRSIFSNFLACNQCTSVMFCNIECMKQNQTHKWECGTFFAMKFFDKVQTQQPDGTTRTRLIAQTVLNAISTFSDVELLMQFVETTLGEDPDQLPTSLHDQVSNYHFFFKLKRRMVTPLDEVKRLYMYTIALPKIRALFDSEEKRRFLMHLVAHHSFIVAANSIGHDGTCKVVNVFSLFNHSCVSNVNKTSHNKSFICTTTRPVKKGEQLFINYLNPAEMKLTSDRRQELLKLSWGFECMCQKCVHNA
ncbi:SET and MYND domain-containing protein DDB_G0273589-like [Bradysia coprophila]|uniref:SET and MYND domain-containing protein DDB_G0273589-like n=1 Tax=Bradysia coprophila TaxID=38358 RepID=UPI00187DBFB0|nr:SET and MYND domain-containing protein DDB_G0273589-like [Bradysia coprophila]